MSDQHNPASAASNAGALLPPKKRPDETTFDITAMIDLVFMMNIFFLVTSITSALAEIDLPTAQYAIAADLENAVVITMTAGSDVAKVFIGDGEEGTPLTEPGDQAQEVEAAVEAGRVAGKTNVIIKAEKRVVYRDIARIMAAAAKVEDVKLKLAIMEMDSP